MCHGSHHHRYDRAPQMTTTLPEEPDHLRASDAERDRTVEMLRTNAGAGRLDSDELEERIASALTARTRADLAALTADLPQPRRSAPRQHHAPRTHRHHPGGLLPIALLLIAIWAVTGAGYFWPIWPLMWFAFAGLASFRRGNTGVIGRGNTGVIR